MSNFIKEWTQKEVDSLTRSFHRHRIFVFVLKFILPITALGLASMLFIYPAVTGKAKKLVLVAQEVKNIKAEDQTMVNPKFLGVGSKNEPYQINAKRAVQDNKTGIVTLQEVTADITLYNGEWISIIAHNGRYDVKDHWVTLDDDVNIFIVDAKSITYQITARDTYIDMAASTMQSSHPVRMQSSLMKFTAQNFIFDSEKEKITFKGPVKLIILKP